MAVGLALPVLLSRVLGGMTAELESESPDGTSSLSMWSNLLRCVGGGMSERDLPAEARISKRFAVAEVNAAERTGWVVTTKAARGRLIALTDAGRESSKVWPERLKPYDDQMSAIDLRPALEALVALLPFELPWHPATYGAADPSAIGGSFVPARPDQGVPAHGTDWRPVLREPGDTTSMVPITGLLSQALVAFSIDYEARPMWPLASTTLVVQHLSRDPAPLADVPDEWGITGNGKSLLERHGVCVVTTDSGKGKQKVVHLTELGDKIRTIHPSHMAECEQRWCDQYGNDVVNHLRSALGAHPAADDDDLPDHLLSSLYPS